MATVNMILDLPTVSVTLGPEWAQDLNAALTLVDAHDHSTGKGVKVTPAGLNINGDLTIGSSNLTNVKSTRYTNNASTLVGASDLRAVYVTGGDLYYNNGGGTAVQITSGAAVTAASDGVSRAYEGQDIGGNTTIAPSATYSYLNVDTTTSVQITLPQASGVSDGRFYVIKDITGLASTNNVTIVPNGTDEIDGDNSNYVLDTNYGEITFVSNGADEFGITGKNFEFTSGTAMLFYQNAAPTGWTIDATNNDKFLRVVSSAGGVSGGAWNSLNHTHTGPSHTHSTPNHIHGPGDLYAQLEYADPDQLYWNRVSESWTANRTADLGGNAQSSSTSSRSYGVDISGDTSSGGSSSTGSGGTGSTSSATLGHSSGSHAYIDVLVCTKD